MLLHVSVHEAAVAIVILKEAEIEISIVDTIVIQGEIEIAIVIVTVTGTWTEIVIDMIAIVTELTVVLALEIAIMKESALDHHPLLNQWNSPRSLALTWLLFSKYTAPVRLRMSQQLQICTKILVLPRP